LINSGEAKNPTKYFELEFEDTRSEWGFKVKYDSEGKE